MSDIVTPTFLQIDLQNLFMKLSNKEQRIDFEKVQAYFNSREAEYLTGAAVYMINSEYTDIRKFETKLKALGYTTRLKDADVTKTVHGNRSFYKQADHDINITIDCLNHMPNFNKWILMSGDGDLADLCKYLRGKGKKVEIWCLKEGYDPKIEPFADKIYFIDENFFFKRANVTVFGINYDGVP